MTAKAQNWHGHGTAAFGAHRRRFAPAILSIHDGPTAGLRLRATPEPPGGPASRASTVALWMVHWTRVLRQLLWCSGVRIRFAVPCFEMQTPHSNPQFQPSPQYCASLVACWRHVSAAFAVAHVIEFLCFSFTKLMVLNRMIECAVIHETATSR